MEATVVEATEVMHSSSVTAASLTAAVTKEDEESGTAAAEALRGAFGQDVLPV